MKLKPIIPILAGLLLLSSCNDNDDATLSYKGNVDSDYIEALAQGRESAGFSVRERHLLKDGKVVKQGEYAGWQSSLNEMRVMDGKAWSKVAMHDVSWGGSVSGIPWMIYCKVAKYKKQIYVASEIVYDKNANTLKYGGLICKIERAEGSVLNLSRSTSDIDNGGVFTEISIYEKTELKLPQRDDMEVFSSDLEAKLGMIAMMREVFGNELRVADYQDRFAENLGNDVINFDELAENLRKGLAF